MRLMLQKISFNSFLNLLLPHLTESAVKMFFLQYDIIVFSDGVFSSPIPQTLLQSAQLNSVEWLNWLPSFRRETWKPSAYLATQLVLIRSGLRLVTQLTYSVMLTLTASCLSCFVLSLSYLVFYKGNNRCLKTTSPIFWSCKDLLSTRLEQLMILAGH